MLDGIPRRAGYRADGHLQRGGALRVLGEVFLELGERISAVHLGVSGRIGVLAGVPDSMCAAC